MCVKTMLFKIGLYLAVVEIRDLNVVVCLYLCCFSFKLKPMKFVRITEDANTLISQLAIKCTPLGICFA